MPDTGPEEVDEESENPCLHNAEMLSYMTTSYTPCIQNPEILMVAMNMFLCRECGTVIRKDLILSKSFLADGTISEKMLEEITAIRNKQAVETQVKAALEKGSPDGITKQ